MPEDELAEWLARSRAGDLDAFCRIVAAVQGPLSRYLLHVVGDRELAADLTQDTLIELYESLHRVEVRQVRGWLYRAATHNALSALRRKRRFGWLPLDWLRGHAARGPEPGAAAVTRTLVREALAALPGDQAACLLLHDAAGLTCAEIAVQQGITLAAAKQRLARGRRAFSTAYQGDRPATGARPHMAESGSPTGLPE